MSIETPEELEALKAVGRVVSEALREMEKAVRPGVSTAQLDAVAAEVFDRHGARSGPQLDYGFPGVTCISVNDEAVHGIPGERQLRDGDLVKLDVTAELDGFYADACVSVAVGEPSDTAAQLIETARTALQNALKVATAGTRLNLIGKSVEQTVTRRGHAVCKDLAGHGIGRRIHEDPHVPNFYAPWLDEPLTEGLVLTIEPIIAAGKGETYAGDDGWTMITADGSLSAHQEHTLVITDGEPILLTT
jgi:methionyl aminopeptidase